MTAGLSRMGRAALAYASRGWQLLPCGQESGKVPLTPHGVKDASADPAAVTAWWQRWPTANVAAACGGGSGFWALDLDGAEGMATVEALERGHDALPATVTQDTPKGGKHYLFRHAPAYPIGNYVRVLPGVDTRDTGGFIIVAPSWSPAVGRAWSWVEGRGPDEIAIAEAPRWLVEAITRPAAPTPAAGGDMPQWLERALGTVAEGTRNATGASVAGHLLRRFVDPRLALALVKAWNAHHCTPPLARAEVHKIVESVAAAELRRRRGAA